MTYLNWPSTHGQAGPDGLTAASASTRSGEPDPFWIFSGGVISSAPVGGSLSRLHQAGKTELLGAMHQIVRRKGRLEGVSLAVVGTDRFDAPSIDVAPC